MNVAVRTSIVLTTMALSTIVHAQVSATNLASFRLLSADRPATNKPASDDPAGSSPSTNANEILPVIEMRDVPITTAIEHLARQAEINFLIDPQLLQKWTDAAVPSVNFRVRNVTAKEILQRLLNVRGLALLEDPVSNIAFIARADQMTNDLFAGRSGRATNTSVSHTTNIIPLIQLSDVPITTAIENLARQASINYMIDPELCRLWDASAEPVLSFRLENVTAGNVLNRLLNVHNLVLMDDPVAHVARIARSDEPASVVDASLLGVDTNKPVSSTSEIIPLIQFQDVPLDLALAHLICQSAINIELDSRLIDSDDTWNFMKTNGIAAINDDASKAREPRRKWFDPMPVISIRWEDITARQAIVALCENYDLIITRDDTTGIIQIKPKEVKRHHRLQLR